MTEPSRERADWLDLLKSMLVLGMVLAHVIQLLGDRNALSASAEIASQVVNLVSFPGFLLAFGIGIGLGGTGRAPLRQLRAALPVLGAVYVSSLAFVILVQADRPTPSLLGDLASLRVLFGYSEFLASFLVLYVALAFLRPTLLHIASRWWWLAAVSAVALPTALFDQPVGWPLSATLLGSSDHPSFPLLPYLPWLLIGISIGLSGGRLALWHVVAALVGSLSFLLSLLTTGEVATRFPPSMLWVVGPGVLLLGYVAAVQWLSRRQALPRWLYLPGRHALLYLLASNLLIFSARSVLGTPLTGIGSAALTTVIIMAAISALQIARLAFAAHRTEPAAHA